MTELTAEAIKRALCDLSVVEPASLGFEVTLAQVYGNGDVVTVFVQLQGNGFYIHDGGNAAMILESLGASLSSAQEAHLRKAVGSYDCDFKEYRVFRQCGSVAEVAACAAMVGCASRLVADQALNVSAVPRFDFRRQLIDALLEAVDPKRVRENEDVVANTGTRYQVSALVLDHRLSQPVAFVEAISGHQSVTRKFRALYDLKNTPFLKETRRIAVYDDARSGITGGDVALLRDVCIPVAFSQRNATPEYASALN